MSTPEAVTELVAAPLAALDLVVEDVTITPAGARRVVRIAVDRALPPATGPVTEAPAPVDLDAIADATRVVSDALDTTDVLGSQPYTLEVTTPGVSRPLTSPEHFRRNIGRLVAATAAGSTTTGRLAVVDGDRITLVVPAMKKTPERTVELDLTALERARVEVEFTRPTPEED